MQEKRYTRLKLKMLLLVVAGAAVAGAAGLFLKEVVIDGFLQDPFARLFVWAATHLFGQSTEIALDAYEHYIRGYKPEWIMLGMVILMLIAFYLALGRFTRWLDEIRSATARVADLSGGEVALPRELAPLERDLNAIRSRLQAREDAARAAEQRRQDLISFLAHDLKTPLTSVVGYLTLLRDEPDLSPEQRAKFTSVALEKAQRLEELLGEFFDITRMDLGADPSACVPIQLTVLLEQLADEFYPIFSEEGLHCSTKIGPHLTVLGDPDKLVRVFDNVLRNAVHYSSSGGEVRISEEGLHCSTKIGPHLTVLGDPDKLVRVFDNVLRNAVHYSSSGGEVRISAAREGDRVEVVISNEGLEIPEGELANIFEKFYRLDAARSTRTGGAGLGLAIAKEIVEHHGGSIRAESNGRFTSFLISLPFYEAAA